MASTFLRFLTLLAGLRVWLYTFALCWWNFEIHITVLDLRLVRSVGEKLKKCKDICDFVYFYDIIYAWECFQSTLKEINYETNKL